MRTADAITLTGPRGPVTPTTSPPATGTTPEATAYRNPSPPGETMACRAQPTRRPPGG
jgi:hypothetical protein